MAEPLVQPSLVPTPPTPIGRGKGRRPKKLPPTNVERFLKRFASAGAGRELWFDLWRDCYEFALPHRNLLAGRGSGDRKNERVFDSTAIDATLGFASELQQALVPPFRHWIRLIAGTDVPPPERPGINELLEEQTDILFEHIDHSNLATEGHESLLDLAVGTGALLLQDSGDDEAPLRFTAVPLAQLVIEEGPRGSIETVYRQHSMPVRLIKRTWPEAKLSEASQTLLEEDPDREIAIIEGCLYEPDLGIYRHVVVEDQARHVLFETGVDESPWIIFRWVVVTGEKYGRGPLMTCLPDIKTANRVTELILRNAALAVSGVYVGVDDGILNPWNVKLAPGAVIPVMNPDSLKPLERSSDFDVGQLVLQDLRTSIKEKLFIEDLPPMDGQPRTATELQIRNQALVRKIGSSFGRLQNELVYKIVRKAVAILVKRGKMASMLVDGKQVDVEYLGPLAQAQANEDLQVFENYAAIVGSLGPEIMMAGTKVEDVPEWVAQKLGLPHKLIRDAGEREQIKQAVAAQAQAQQQPEGSQAMEQMGEPDSGPPIE
jgi:hypothetical protein